MGSGQYLSPGHRNGRRNQGLPGYADLPAMETASNEFGLSVCTASQDRRVQEGCHRIPEPPQGETPLWWLRLRAPRPAIFIGYFVYTGGTSNPPIRRPHGKREHDFGLFYTYLTKHELGMKAAPSGPDWIDFEAMAVISGL